MPGFKSDLSNRKTRSFTHRLSALLMLMVLFGTSVSLSAETLIFEDIVSVGQSTWSGGEITWQHTIPADILSRATRVEASVGATDVDYPNCKADCPDCSTEDCEHDRLYVNGSEIGLLSGSNDSTRTNPLTIPLSLLRSGSNEYRVVNEVVAHRWWIEITESVIRIYEESGTSGTESGGTTAEPISNLHIKKTQSRSTVTPGQPQSYTITVTNTGDTGLTGLTVTDRLDPNLFYQSSRSSMKHSQQYDLHRWYLKNLAPGKEVKIEIETEVSPELTAGKPISNTAEATASELDQAVISNTVTALSSYINVEPDDLIVSKRVNRRESRVGKILVYQVTIENRGAGTVFNLSLEDYLPNGFNFVSGSVLKDGLKYLDPNGSRKLSWELGTLLAGGRTDIRYQVVIGSNVKRGKNTNRAEATAMDGGGNRVRGYDEAIVMIGGGDIEIPAEIEAIVFLDTNDNGIRNSSDKPLEKVRVVLSNGEKRESTKEGAAVFKELLSGFYAIGIDPRSLPKHTSIRGDATQLVRLMEGEHARVPLPVQQNIGPARLSGMVYRDTNNNGNFDEGEQLFKPQRVSLDGTLITRTQKGRYLFARVESGPHILLVNSGGTTVRKKIELTIGDNHHDLPLPGGGLTIQVEEE